MTDPDCPPRNRRISATDALNQITEWAYDKAGNLIKGTRPGAKYRTWDIYDAMNRIKQTTGFLSEKTSYVYDLAGNMTQLTDAKGAIYGFSYDLLNRKTKETYPLDATGVARTETWSYDVANHLSQYKNPAGQVKTLSYDNRNRQTGATWSANGQSVTTAYDAANRVTSIGSGPSTVAFGYDNANRQIWEDQALSGLTVPRVNTGRDADGNRANLSVTTNGKLNFTATYD